MRTTRYQTPTRKTAGDGKERNQPWVLQPKDFVAASFALTSLAPHCAIYITADALRLAAQSLWRARNYLGDCFRRYKPRQGTAKAITTMAHKLARILWHLIKHHQPYNPQVWALAEEKLKQKKLRRLQQNAASLGYQLTCAPASKSPSFL